MKKHSLLGVALFFSIEGINAAGINVPDDFPNTFAMDLLGGILVVDEIKEPSVCTGPCTIHYPRPVDGSTLNTDGFSILFDATAFHNGTSALTLTSDTDWLIGSANVAGNAVDLYVNGSGTGVLQDIDGTKGHWSLEVPIYGVWGSTLLTLPDMVLTTNASFAYATFDALDMRVLDSITGSAMDYSTGDAFLVGQAIIPEFYTEGFGGYRVTLGISANDPVLSAVPIPSAIWLLGSGVALLTGFAKRRGVEESVEPKTTTLQRIS